MNQPSQLWWAMTAVAVAVVRCNDRFLVGERPPGVPLAGYAEFPGGKLREGEAPEEGAVRECLEETGLSVEACGTLLAIEHQYSHGRIVLHFVDCVYEGEGQPLPPFRWVDKQDLANLRFPEANSAVLAHLLN